MIAEGDWAMTGWIVAEGKNAIFPDVFAFEFPNRIVPVSPSGKQRAVAIARCRDSIGGVSGRGVSLSILPNLERLEAP